MSGPRTNAAFYAAPVSEFLAASDEEAYAPLAAPKGYTLAPEQLSAWHLQLPVLRAALRGLARVPQEQGPVPFGDEAPAPWIHLEFDIPRLGRRVDAVLVLPECVIPIEFKVGAKKFERLDIEQAWDYGLDLKNFHAPSHAAPIFPILCATEARDSDRRWKPPHADGVRPPFRCSGDSLGRAVRLALEEKWGRERFFPKIAPVPISPATWGTGSYSPTPTIIEAARSLYARHTVHDITRSDAGAVNLAATSGCIERIITAAKAGRRKAIVFVTGVPGAGKTLVGLNVATRHGERSDAAYAVFLSGNGPLVAVLREALARDDLERRKKEKVADTFSGSGPPRIGLCRSAVKAFIQNVHHFRDDTLRDPAPPDDHVVVFDEAQRAWDARQLASFMKRKKGRPGFTQSESELLLSALDRHDDWAVVVCLVGGGQEINTGEAGIGAWLESVRAAFPGWDVFISPHLTDSEYAATGALARLTESRAKTEAKTVPAPISASEMVAGTLFAGTLTTDPSLHLSTSMRSFRAESLSRFVKALLDGEAESCRELLAAFRDQYPIVLTRSMRAARRWIRQQRRGTERAGLVASSSARAAQAPRDRHSGKHRPGALVSELRERHPLVALSPPHLSQFSRGPKNENSRTDVKKPERRQYLKNASLVLLTRARQGMVIFVPPGAKRDKTRSPGFYEGVSQHLTDLGVPQV